VKNLFFGPDAGFGSKSSKSPRKQSYGDRGVIQALRQDQKQIVQ
jgi:hypothetical protein